MQYPLAILATVAATVAACASSPPVRPRPNVTEKTIAAEEPKASTVTTSREEVEPFHATSGPGDAPVPYVRDERSSRLALPLPRGRVREEWTAALGLKPAFVLAAGNRFAVTGPDAWGVWDARGNRVDAGKRDAAGVRLDRASGAVVPDDSRSADTPIDAKIAVHDGLAVMVKDGAVYVGERAIEGKFEAYDVAIDESELACVVVRQGNDLALWTIPIGSNGGIGRHKLPGRAKALLAPPVLGKSLRVFVLETGLLALGLDGKRLWERRGVPTGGVTITSDDHVLVADNAKILAIDPRGKATEVYAAKDLVFLTPPIVTVTNQLVVASAQLLHVLTFS